MVNFASAMLPIRGVQMLLAILNLGLSGYMVSYGYGSYCYDDFYSTYYGYYYATCYKRRVSEFGFALFTSIWTILTLGFLIPASMGKLPEKLPARAIIVLTLDTFNMCIWLASWLAIAVIRGVSLFFAGCGTGAECDVPAAYAAFGAVEWLLFLATMVFGILAIQAAKREAAGATQPAPAMAPAPAAAPTQAGQPAPAQAGYPAPQAHELSPNPQYAQA